MVKKISISILTMIVIFLTIPAVSSMAATGDASRAANGMARRAAAEAKKIEINKEEVKKIPKK